MELHLFLRSHPLMATILELGNLEALQQSDFNPSLPTKIFAHGWNASPRSAYNSRDGKLTMKKKTICKWKLEEYDMFILNLCNRIPRSRGLQFHRRRLVSIGFGCRIPFDCSTRRAPRWAAHRVRQKNLTNILWILFDAIINMILHLLLT